MIPNRDTILKRLEKHAAYQGYIINSNKDVVDKVISGIILNCIKYGKSYCPCRIVTGNEAEDDKNVCPCDSLPEDIVQRGMCKCRVFIMPITPDGEDETAEPELGFC